MSAASAAYEAQHVGMYEIFIMISIETINCCFVVELDLELELIAEFESLRLFHFCEVGRESPDVMMRNVENRFQCVGSGEEVRAAKRS